LRQGLRDLGYVEGRNINIEFRTALGHADRLPGLAEELVRLKADVIFAAATPAIEAVKRATSTIPIVMALGGDPVASGLVASLSKPGGNVTGLSSMSAELSGKLLQLLKETVPRLKRVAVLWNPDSPLSPVQKKMAEDLKTAALSLSIELVFVQVGTPEGFDAAFAAASRARVQAMFVAEGPLLYSQRAIIAQLAAKARLPAIYRARVFVDTGGLMSYGASWSDQVRQAAGYVDKILKGAKPADLPIEQPTKFELVVNLKTAKALGITIPQSILVRADEVIK
jgi:putative ABC transport system substrate-binding protein